MRKTLPAWLILAGLLIGCGGRSEPAIRPGSEAVLYRPDGGPVQIWLDPGIRSGPDPGPDSVTLPAGTRLLVLEERRMRTSQKDSHMYALQVRRPDGTFAVGWVMADQVRPAP